MAKAPEQFSQGHRTPLCLTVSLGHRDGLFILTVVWARFSGSPSVGHLEIILHPGDTSPTVRPWSWRNPRELKEGTQLTGILGGLSGYFPTHVRQGGHVQTGPQLDMWY